MTTMRRRDGRRQLVYNGHPLYSLTPTPRAGTGVRTGLRGDLVRGVARRPRDRAAGAKAATGYGRPGGRGAGVARTIPGVPGAAGPRHRDSAPCCAGPSSPSPSSGSSRSWRSAAGRPRAELAPSARSVPPATAGFSPYVPPRASCVGDCRIRVGPGYDSARAGRPTGGSSAPGRSTAPAATTASGSPSASCGPATARRPSSRRRPGGRPARPRPSPPGPRPCAARAGRALADPGPRHRRRARERLARRRLVGPAHRRLRPALTDRPRAPGQPRAVSSSDSAPISSRGSSCACSSASIASGARSDGERPPRRRLRLVPVLRARSARRTARRRGPACAARGRRRRSRARGASPAAAVDGPARPRAGAEERHRPRPLARQDAVRASAAPIVSSPASWSQRDRRPRGRDVLRRRAGAVVLDQRERPVGAGRDEQLERRGLRGGVEVVRGREREDAAGAQQHRDRAARRGAARARGRRRRRCR